MTELYFSSNPFKQMLTFIQLDCIPTASCQGATVFHRLLQMLSLGLTRQTRVDAACVCKLFAGILGSTLHSIIPHSVGQHPENFSREAAAGEDWKSCIHLKSVQSHNVSLQSHYLCHSYSQLGKCTQRVCIKCIKTSYEQLTNLFYYPKQCVEKKFSRFEFSLQKWATYLKKNVINKQPFKNQRHKNHSFHCAFINFFLVFRSLMSLFNNIMQEYRGQQLCRDLEQAKKYIAQTHES